MQIFKYYILFFCTSLVFAQSGIDAALEKYNTGSVDYIYTEDLIKILESDSIVILDARAKNEFIVSHIKNAIWVGYNQFNEDVLKSIPADKKIIVYCSIGVRSEDIGEKIKTLGYMNVFNLYGGIFAWVNKDYPIYKNEKVTNKVHAFDKEWGKHLVKGKKVY